MRALTRALAPVLVLLAVAPTACSAPPPGPADSSPSSSPSALPSPAGSTTPSPEVPDPSVPVVPTSTPSTRPAAYAVPAPGPLERRLLTADVLVTGAETLPARLVRRIRALDGVEKALPLSLAVASVDGRTLDVAAVDPAEFRRFTPLAVARADAVWDRLAGGEVAVDTSVSRRLVSEEDTIRLGNRKDSPAVHVGAYAPLVKGIEAVVNRKRGAQLGLPEHNALLVSTGQLTPSAIADELRGILGDRATMKTLALEFADALQTAVLTGGSVSEAVGHFSYTDGPDGTIRPDQGWVSAYIRTEQVPILGTVTCNRAMLPQLRGALAEVVRNGLESAIHPGEYAGCYYPRYINRTASYGLSLHSWGIAVDLNVPGNQRGTVGEMDRRVVEIFKRWGFAWGGDWNYTDPMHFEMNAVVRAR